MPVQRVTPILNVSNVAESIAWFEQLGWRQSFTWGEDEAQPDFGGVCSGEAEIFLCCGGQG